MAVNKILQFGSAASNELNDTDYAADAQRTSGNQPGIARSPLVNKVLHQLSTMSSGLAQYLAGLQATDLVDSLTPAQVATILSNVLGGTATKAANGYLKLQGGLILQWGSVPSANLATTNASFTVAFPGGPPFQVLASGYNISGGVQAYVTVNDATATTCAFNAFYGATGGVAPSLATTAQVQIKYLAIGV